MRRKVKQKYKPLRLFATYFASDQPLIPSPSRVSNTISCPSRSDRLRDLRDFAHADTCQRHDIPARAMRHFARFLFVHSSDSSDSCPLLQAWNPTPAIMLDIWTGFLSTLPSLRLPEMGAGSRLDGGSRGRRWLLDTVMTVDWGKKRKRESDQRFCENLLNTPLFPVCLAFALLLSGIYCI